MSRRFDPVRSGPIVLSLAVQFVAVAADLIKHKPAVFDVGKAATIR